MLPDTFIDKGDSYHAATVHCFSTKGDVDENEEEGHAE
jgi:hypothetical protein